MLMPVEIRESLCTLVAQMEQLEDIETRIHRNTYEAVRDLMSAEEWHAFADEVLPLVRIFRGRPNAR